MVGFWSKELQKQPKLSPLGNHSGLAVYIRGVNYEDIFIAV